MSRPHEPIPMPDGSTSTGDTKVATVRPEPQAEQTTATGTKMPWQEQLKIVLLRKALIIYIVMAENHFISQQVKIPSTISRHSHRYIFFEKAHYGSWLLFLLFQNYPVLKREKILSF